MEVALNPLIPCLALFLALLPACSTTQRDASAREWQRAECNRVIDKEDRDRCLRRVDEAYGASAHDSRREPPKR